MLACQHARHLIYGLLLVLLGPSLVWGQAVSRREIGLVNPLEYGATCTTATLNAALTAIGSSQKSLQLTPLDRAGAPCTWTITSSVTVPANVILHVPSGVAVTISAGQTFTLARQPQQARPRWWSGAGTLVIQDQEPLGHIVSHYATGGDGSSANPWTGWEAKTPWAAYGRYHFPAGTYSYSVQPPWSYNGLQLLGQGDVVLSWQGTGPAVFLDAGATEGQYLNGLIMENFRITGQANITYGLYLRGVHRSQFRNLKFGPYLSNAHEALRVEFGVLDVFDHIMVSSNVTGTWVNSPKHGVVLERRGSGAERSTANVFHNFTAEGIHTTNGAGIYILNGDSNIFYGGTSESNYQGIVVAANSLRNTFHSIFMEDNDRCNIDEAGDHTNYINMTSSGIGTASQNIVEATAGHTLFLSGQYTEGLTILAGANSTQLLNTRVDGTLTDGGGNTTIVNSSISGDTRTRLPSIDGIGAAPIIIGQGGIGVGIGQTGHTLRKYFSQLFPTAGVTIPNNAEGTLVSSTYAGVFLGDTCTASLTVDNQGLLIYAAPDADGHVKATGRNTTGGSITLAAANMRISCAQH